MHELSIALSLLDLLEEESERRGDARISAIHVKIGPLSGVVPAALVSAYELAREPTAFAETRMEVREMGITARCPKCEAVREIASVQEIVCGVCGTPTPEIITGRELEVCALEIEE